MKAFVTGACGFIGSHLAEALVKEGHDVTAMAIISARDTFGWLDECEGMRKVRGDVRDAEQMRRHIAGHDIVFHLAAHGSVPYSYEAPRSFIDTNVTGTLNVLEACKETGAKMVHTSTSEVYGTALYTPQDINHPLQAQSPYAASKIAADKLVEAYTRTYGMDTVTLRPFNTYGPRQSRRAVIPSIIRQAILPAFDDVTLGRTDTKRDFSYVDDTVQAFISVSALNGVYSSGSGKTITIGELAEKTIQFCNAGMASINPLYKPVISDQNTYRPDNSEVNELRACFDNLHAATGWVPSWSLDDGLKKTIKWWFGYVGAVYEQRGPVGFAA